MVSEGRIDHAAGWEADDLNDLWQHAFCGLHLDYIDHEQNAMTTDLGYCVSIWSV